MQADQMHKEITRACDLQSKVHYNRIYTRINKGTCGLQEVGALSNKQLRQYLASYGHMPAPHTLGIWKHSSNKIMLTLVADDFGVKCLTKESGEHLVAALKEKHEDVEVTGTEHNVPVKSAHQTT